MCAGVTFVRGDVLDNNVLWVQIFSRAIMFGKTKVAPTHTHTPYLDAGLFPALKGFLENAVLEWFHGGFLVFVSRQSYCWFYHRWSAVGARGGNCSPLKFC